MAILNGWLWPILDRLGNYGAVALGLGFVIFIHELGHFLVAKWNGVKVEVFALGLPLGPTLVSFRRGIGLRLGSTRREYLRRLAEAEAAGEAPESLGLGETEYAITSVPLGGYVKMLGEGEAADSPEAHTTDPRAYPNKPVFSRMAIISAGVTMNLITGMLFFIGAYGKGGLPTTPAIIGSVVAGQPAYEAGLRPGDRITAIDGREGVDFLAMKRMTAMSGAGHVLRLTVNRPGVEAPMTIEVAPERQGNAELKTMGVQLPFDLALSPRPFRAPAGLAEPGSLEKTFQPGDRVVAAGPVGSTPEPAADVIALDRLLARHRDAAMTIVLERPGKKKGQAPARVEATLPPVPFVGTGLRMTMGPVVAVQPDSPAAKAGLKKGDTITRVEGLETIDPLRLPDELAARAGQAVRIDVARGTAAQPVSLMITPEALPAWTELTAENEPMEAPSIGAAFQVTPKIAAVEPGSPADRAGLKPGQTITAVTFTFREKDKERSQTFKLGGDEASWPSVVQLLQERAVRRIDLTAADRKTPAAIVPEPVAGWFNPQRGLSFDVIQHDLPPMGLAASIAHGLDETWETIGSVYGMFASLWSGDISPKALGGPMMIADIASRSVRSGLVSFLQFLGVLSLNLAVINFLPVPPLDGGQMVFLLAEKLRGRPLPESALNAGMIVGLLLVLGLMSFVLYQDVLRYVVG